MPAAFAVITAKPQIEAKAVGNCLFLGWMTESPVPAKITEQI